ncbi:hypothetical protein C9426_33325 [Serratia sp. S1B]|nr:hypothetical protein C9426_33325 [Serratia sp. S1B]
MKLALLSSIPQRRLRHGGRTLALVLCLLLGAVTAVQAEVTCNISNPRADVTPLAPGGLSISGGSELPLGTMLYRFRWSPLPFAITCSGGDPNSTVSIDVIANMFAAPGSLSAWNGSPYADAVYSTGIDGVGVTSWNGSKPIRYGSPIVIATIIVPQEGTLNVTGNAVSLDSGLIKIGNIASANYIINGADLPTIGVSIASTNGGAIIAPSSNIQTSFTGQLDVTQPTCTTPDVNVSLGTYDVRDFNGVGSATPWVNTSLTLINCPIFQGYHSRDSSVDLNPTYVPGPDNNQIGLILTPLNPIIDANNGIMAVSSMTSASAASGVGIQISQGTANRPQAPFNFNSEVRYTQTTTGTSLLTIPLSARYIQTDNTVTPGRGDGQIIFTINYY